MTLRRRRTCIRGYEDSPWRSSEGESASHSLKLISASVCGDSRLLRTVWTNFDQTGKSDVFRKMVSSLGKLVNERPVLLGVGAQMHGTGVPSGDGSAASGTYLDMGLGMVSSAASAGLNSVNSMMGSSGGGLGTHSSMKLRL